MNVDLGNPNHNRVKISQKSSCLNQFTALTVEKEERAAASNC